jgi:hypothetical protein
MSIEKCKKSKMDMLWQNKKHGNNPLTINSQFSILNSQLKKVLPIRKMFVFLHPLSTEKESM